MKDYNGGYYTCISKKQKTVRILLTLIILMIAPNLLNAKPMDCYQFVKFYGLAFYMHRIAFTTQQGREIFREGLTQTIKELDPRGSIFTLKQTADLVSNINSHDFQYCNYQMHIAAIYNQKAQQRIDEAKVYELVTKHFLLGMDPHSVFFDRKRWKKINSKLTGKDEGIGVVFSMKGSYPQIVKVVPGGPSENILLPGDLILSINDIKTESLTKEDIDALLNSEHKENLIVTVGRSNKILNYEIEAVKYNVRSVDWRFLNSQGIMHLVLREFAQGSSSEISQALEEAQISERITGLILDLRFNPGGSLAEALKIISMFVSGDVLATVVGKKGKENLIKEEEPETVEREIPIIVLINGFSASASELLAQSLKDYKRAVIVGSPSFGKGTVQRVAAPDWLSYVLEDEYDIAATVTISQFYSAFGNSPQRDGVTPHITVIDQELKKRVEIERERVAAKGGTFIARESDYKNALPPNNIESSVDLQDGPTNNIEDIVTSLKSDIEYDNVDGEDYSFAKDVQLAEAYKTMNLYTRLCSSFHLYTCSFNKKEVYASLQ